MPFNETDRRAYDAGYAKGLKDGKEEPGLSLAVRAQCQGRTCRACCLFLKAACFDNLGHAPCAAGWTGPRDPALCAKLLGRPWEEAYVAAAADHDAGFAALAALIRETGWTEWQTRRYLCWARNLLLAAGQPPWELSSLARLLAVVRLVHPMTERDEVNRAGHAFRSLNWLPKDVEQAKTDLRARMLLKLRAGDVLMVADPAEWGEPHV